MSTAEVLIACDHDIDELGGLTANRLVHSLAGIRAPPVGLCQRPWSRSNGGVSEQKLEVKRDKLSEPSFVEPVYVNFRSGLGEEFVVVSAKNRRLRSDGFELLAMQIVGEFTGKLVGTVEVGVELIMTVVRPDGLFSTKSATARKK